LEQSNHPTSEHRTYLTTPELAAQTGLSISTIRRLVSSGRLRPIQPGGPRHRLVFLANAIEQINPEIQTPEDPVGSPVKSPRGPAPRWRGKLKQ